MTPVWKVCKSMIIMSSWRPVWKVWDPSNGCWCPGHWTELCKHSCLWSIHKVTPQKITDPDYTRIRCDRFIWVGKVGYDISRNSVRIWKHFLGGGGSRYVYKFWGCLTKTMLQVSPKDQIDYNPPLNRQQCPQTPNVFLKMAFLKNSNCWALFGSFSFFNWYVYKFFWQRNSSCSCSPLTESWISTSLSPGSKLEDHSTQYRI